MANSLALPQAAKHRVTTWASNSTPRCICIHKRPGNLCAHKTLYTNVHSSTIHNSPKGKRNQMSINWWMHKQNVIRPYHGILFSNKKEWNSDTHYNMDEPWQHHGKWKKASIQTTYYTIPFIWNLQNIKKVDQRLPRARSVEGGTWGATTKGHEVSFRADENALKLTMVMIARFVNISQNTVYFKYVNCMACELNLNTAVKKKKRALNAYLAQTL